MLINPEFVLALAALINAVARLVEVVLPKLF
jgi:hypothetical protein